MMISITESVEMQPRMTVLIQELSLTVKGAGKRQAQIFPIRFTELSSV